MLAGPQRPPLYSRWVNHIVWRDTNGKLWEVTPHFELPSHREFWEPTVFIRDDESPFEVATDENCCPRPAIYAAVRVAGEWTADCLCQAERAPRETQDLWLDRALFSIRLAGFEASEWRVERVGDRISDAWLIA